MALDLPAPGEEPWGEKLNAALLEVHSTALDAQDAADSKTTTYYQDNAPAGTGYVVGDQWYDTNDGNKPYVWNGTAWASAQDATIAAAASTASSAAATAGSKNQVFVQGTAPAGVQAGDIWIDTANGNAVKTWSGSTWNIQQFSTGALAVGAITAGSAIIASINADVITTGTLNAARVGSNQMVLDATGTYGIQINHTSAGTAAELATFDTGTVAATFYTQKGSLGAVRSVTTSYALLGSYSGMIQNASVPTLTVKGWSGQTTSFFEVQDSTAAVKVSAPAAGGLVITNGAALSTTGTTGFVSIPWVNGVPTGVPGTTYRPTGAVPMVWDAGSTPQKLWVYSGGWKSVSFS